MTMRSTNGEDEVRKEPSLRKEVIAKHGKESIARITEWADLLSTE